MEEETLFKITMRVEWKVGNTLFPHPIPSILQFLLQLMFLLMMNITVPVMLLMSPDTLEAKQIFDDVMSLWIYCQEEQ